MTGRGIDQILPHPVHPRLHESYVRDARQYVQLAEEAAGPIPRRADFTYIWGDALAEWDRRAPDARIVNLETSVTTSEAAWWGKAVHYRMHPRNVPCLTAARVDVASLANNHVLDFGYPGLLETLDTLADTGIRTAGAGRTLRDARTPAAIARPGRPRIVVTAVGSATSGIPPAWEAGEETAGIDLVPDLSPDAARAVARRATAGTGPGDIVLVSVHWGDNWGFEVPAAQVRFAHALIDGGVDVVHGHSSHHVRPFEVYDNRLVLYSCGDFLTDYEGISGHEEFRGELSLMYFAALDGRSGTLQSLDMVPMRTIRFRLTHASAEEAAWLRQTLSRISAPFGVRVGLTEQRVLTWRP